MTKREQRRRERELKRLGYRPLSAAEQVLYIISYKAKHDLRSAMLKIKHNFKMWKGCKHICLWCEYYDDCIEASTTVAVEHKGYTIQQSGVNFHTMIIDGSGKMLYHAQTEKPLTEQELRQIVDWYIDFQKENMQL